MNSEIAVVLDKKFSFDFTAFLVADSLQRKAKGENLEGVKEQDLPLLINSLNEYATGGNFASFKDLQRISESMNQLGLAIPFISNPKLENKGDSHRLRWTYIDIFGREVEGNRKISIHYDGKTQETSDNFLEIRSQKKDLSIEMTQTGKGNLKLTTKQSVYLAETVKLKEINMALTKGNDRIKEYAYTDGSTIICNQDNKLHIMFKIDKNIEPEYSAFYLKHSESGQFDRISAASSLTYSPDQSSLKSLSEVYWNYRSRRCPTDSSYQRQVSSDCCSGRSYFVRNDSAENRYSPNQVYH